MLALAACGGEERSEEPPDPARESAHRPAAAPSGWRTVRNRAAGLSVSVPPGWSARVNGAATLLRSRDRLMALSLSADRSDVGRSLPVARYARRTVGALPAFKGAPVKDLGRVRGSPYDSALVQARSRRAIERARVGAFRKDRSVTYTAVAFSNSRVAPRVNDGLLVRVLASLRGRPPRI